MTPLVIPLFYVSLFVVPMGIAFLVRFLLYRKELRDFQNGGTNETTYLTCTTFELRPVHGEDADCLVQRVEEVVRDLRLSYAKTSDAFCCFSRLFASYPFKLMIRRNGTGYDFTFYDRLYKRMVQPSVIKRAEETFLVVFSVFQERVLTQEPGAARGADAECACEE